MDLLEMLEGSWFGRPAEPQEAAEDHEQPMLRRGSAGSLSDAAANEQETRRRDSMRRQPSAGQAAAKGLPRPHQNSRRLREEEEDNGVLGTWAGRQRFFSDHLRQEEEERQQQQQQQQRQQRGGMPPLPPPTAGAAAAAAAQEAGGPSEREAELPYVAPPRTETPVVLAPPPLPLRANDHPSGATLDAEMNAAWRWRFTRKWQAEQMKQFDGPAPPGPNGLAEGEDEEEWAAALRLMDAVDGGLNMQIGRTLSLQNSSMVDASSMGLDHSLLMSPGLSQLLLEGSIKESPLRDEAVAATTQIVSVARKAQHLRQQQQEIERQVTERWEAASGGSPWAAQHLPAVQIDSWSSFAFVLVRLSEQRSQRQKLLVRGRNGATEQQTFATTEQEAARAAIAHRLPGPRVELVACGRMEWVAASPGQRRTLLVWVGRLLPPAAKDSRLHNTSAASAVVAELARASFPSGDFLVTAAQADGAASSSKVSK